MERTKAEDLLGITCPGDSKYYSCKRTGFIGCCGVDPCKMDTCPPEELFPTGYSNTEQYALIQPQDCVSYKSDDVGQVKWFVCNAAQPPFLGCCAKNACETNGCNKEDMRPASMSRDDSLSAIFKEYVDDKSGLSKGAIAGIAAGIGAVVIIAVACLVWFCLRKKKQNQRPAVPAKPDTYIPNTPHTPHSTMTHFSPPPQSAHPTMNGNYPFSPKYPGADSPAYYFHQHQQQQQQQQQMASPYFHNGVPVPPMHPPMPPYPSVHKSYHEQPAPVSASSNHYAAELPAVPDAPSRNSMVNRAASTTTYKGSGNKRESAMSRMTAPPESHHTHKADLPELGSTQVTAEMGDSFKRENLI